jgi:hypothetical protein
VNNPPLSTQAFAIGQFLARIVSELRYLVVDDQDTERHFRDGLSRPSDGILTALQALYREMGDLDIEVRREIEARIAAATVSIDRLDTNLHVDRGEFIRGYFQGIARRN